jgi:hypothetical protein
LHPAAAAAGGLGQHVKLALCQLLLLLLLLRADDHQAVLQLLLLLVVAAEVGLGCCCYAA